MGNVIEFELIAAERSNDFRREASLRQRAAQAERTVGRFDLLTLIFGRKRAA